MLPLKRWLEASEISQSVFAKEMGVTQPTVWEWLNGECFPSPKNLRRLSERTGLTIDELLASEISKSRLKTINRKPV